MVARRRSHATIVVASPSLASRPGLVTPLEEARLAAGRRGAVTSCGRAQRAQRVRVHPGAMDDRQSVLARGRGVALRRDFLAAGFDVDEVMRAVRSGLLVRVRRGAYADAGLWHSLDERGRHLLTARAVLAALTPQATLSHVSAAIAWGLPVWGADLSNVHVTRRMAGQSRHEAGVVHHRGHLPDAQVTEQDGLRITTPARTVLDVARLAGFEPGVVTADAALNQQLVTASELFELHIATSDWPASNVAGRVVGFADGLAESVGESRSRVLCHTAGLPRPQLQVEVLVRGRRYRLDMLIAEAMTAIEFDGRLKYRLGESDDPRVLESILWEEKRREDDVRSVGFRFVRVTWHDLERPRETAQRLRSIVQNGLPGSGGLPSGRLRPA